jgi:hypothetical protein
VDGEHPAVRLPCGDQGKKSEDKYETRYIGLRCFTITRPALTLPMTTRQGDYSSEALAVILNGLGESFVPFPFNGPLSQPTVMI